MAATSPRAAGQPGQNKGARGSYNKKSLHKAAAKQDHMQKAKPLIPVIPVWGQALQSSGGVAAGWQSTEMHGGLVVTRR